MVSIMTVQSYFMVHLDRLSRVRGGLLSKIFRDSKKREAPETTQWFPAGNGMIVTDWCLYHNIVRTFQTALCAL